MAPADDTALTTGASCVAGTRSACPGCGVLLPEAEGAAHPYLACSPACWALYGEVLAREYGDRAYFRVHQLTVDTYAVQHPGRPERRSIQSTALHLITLCLVVHGGADPADGPKLHKRLAKRPGFDWLDPPRLIGRLTVADVHRARSADSNAAVSTGRWRQLVEDRQVELPESLRVAEEVEFDDLAIPHRDGADRERLPVAEGDGPGNAVDQRRPNVQPDLGVAERLARDRRRAAYLPQAARPEILPQDDIRIEHRHEPIEVAVTRSRQKRVDNLMLRFEVRVGLGSLGAHASARPAGELARCLGGATDDRRDLVEGQGEDVVQHEREPLRWGQRLEHYEQRQSDGIGQQRLVLGIDSVRPVDKRIGEPPGERLLPPRLARAEHVQRHAGDDGRQPSAQVLDLVAVGAVEAQPGLLDGVVRLAERAEHPVGHTSQPAPVLLELLRQPVALIHCHVPLSGWVIAVDPRDPGDVTSRRRTR